jgi:thiol-disulfide isomerase/thioredoxin
MKFLSFTLTLLLLNSLVLQALPITDENRLVVTGVIANPSSKTIKLIALELMGRENHTVKLDKEGRFYFDIELISAHDNYLLFGNKLVPFFANPSDSIHLEFDNAHIDNSITFFGDGASFNNHLRIFFTELGNFLQKSSFFGHQQDASPIEFKELCSHLQNHMTDKIDSIMRTLKPENNAKDWMNTYVKYRAAEELLQYGRHHQEELPADYFEFLDELEDPQKHDLKCSQFYEDFLNDFTTYQMTGKMDGYDQVRNYLSEGDTLAGLQLYLEFMDQIFISPISKDLVLTKTVYSYLYKYQNFAESIFQVYAQLVMNNEYLEYIKQQLSQLESTNYQPKTIDDLVSLDFVGEVFSEIKAKHSNKVLYIDLWGTWCKACIMQFGFSNKLHHNLKNEPIEFIYLCCNSNKEKWKESIDKYNLSGTHFLLTNEQYSVLSSEFNFSGLPHYLIIDKRGIVVDENAKSPNNVSLSMQLRDLASH